MTKLSRSKIDLFVDCPRCFWLDLKKGIKRPPPFPYTINNAIDYLLKQEFDVFREKGKPHPIMTENSIDAIPYQNEKLKEWRHNFTGVRHEHEPTDFTVFGAVDDVLEFSDGKLAPLDYKSTGSKTGTVYDRFQLQMDVYTFLLEKQGYKTVRKGCLAFYIVDKENGFNDKLPFRKEIVMIDTDPTYVQGIFKEAVNVLKGDKPVNHSPDCQYGKWFDGITNLNS